jgi:PAS domain S-box-containing protein
MNSSDRSAASISLRYLLVLGLLALLAVVNYVMLEQKIRASHNSTQVLNLTGRQRFLLQRSTWLAERLVESSDPQQQQNLRQELSETLRLMDSSHQAIMKGSPSIGLAPVTETAARELYLGGPQALDPAMQKFIEHGEALVAAPAATLTADNADFIAVHNAASASRLMGSLDRAVEHHQQQSEAELGQLRQLQRWMLAGMLTVIVLTALVVFRPMQRRIEQEMSKLQTLNETLEQRVAERSAAAEQRAAELAASRGALEEKTRILQSILDGMSDGVVVVNPSGKFLLFNASAEAMLGIGASDTPPERWTEHYSLYLPDRVTPFPTEELPLVRAMQGESVDRCEMFVRLASGLAGVWLTAAARPLRDQQGRLTGAVAVLQDSTRHKQAEAALRESEALYQSLMDTLPLNFFRKDLDGAFTFANQRFCDTVGRPLDDVLAKTDFDLFPIELAEKYLRDDHRVIDTGEPFEVIEQHRKPGGELIYVQVLKAPVYDAQRNIIGIQGIFWDVTGRKLDRQREAESQAG